MVSSRAATVSAYLDALPPDRREVIAAVRDLVNRSLPAGFEEGIQYGMIGWCVPLSRYPDTYNGQPLGIVALAAQKNHLSLYLMAVYGSERNAEFERAWAASGKRLNMGKSCVRFKKLDDLALDVLAEVLGWMTPEQFIARYEEVRGRAAARRCRSRPPFPFRPDGQVLRRVRSRGWCAGSWRRAGAPSMSRVRFMSSLIRSGWSRTMCWRLA